MDLEISVRLTPPLAELGLRGELAFDSADKIGWTVEQALRRGCTLVAVDLRGVTFIDCSGIGAFVEAKHRLARR